MAWAAQGPAPGERLVTIRGRIRVAPEYVGAIQFPTQRSRKRTHKAGGKLVAISGARDGEGVSSVRPV
jgi:hypothetical protein